MSDKCSVLVADPPWFFKDRLPGKNRGAEKFYPCLPLHEIIRFPLPEIADDAVLFMWRVAAMQQESLDVVKAWGFTVKSELVWDKETVAGNPHFGMGRVLRASHETCLVATRGRFKPASRSVRSRFSAPVGRHSEKPDAFYSIVEQIAGDRRPIVELFARRQREGWICLGNEMPAGSACSQEQICATV